MLKDSGIPLTIEERIMCKSPFVLLGGSNSYVSSILHGEPGKPHEGSGLVDGVLVGDAEGAFPQILRILSSEKNLPRKELLEKITAEVPGFYNPAAYIQIFHSNGRLSEIRPIEEAPFPVKPNRAKKEQLGVTFSVGPISFDEESAGKSHLLVTSGCPYFCSFCKESWEQKPYRERDSKILAEAAINLKTNLGLSELSIMSFNPGSLSYLSGLLGELEPLFGRVSLKSQRFDAVVNFPEILERQLEAGKRTFTCAMEGISQRLRNFLQKNLTTETLLAGFDGLFKRNIRQMKVFLIVTGLETSEDLTEFESLLTQLKKKMEPLRGKPVITFSLAGLFRPPLTPLQYFRTEIKIERFQGIYDKIIASVQKAGFDHRISAGPEDALFSEYIAYADRRSTRILIDASITKGYRYRGQISAEVYGFWSRELKKKNLFNTFVETKILPWDDIDCGISKSFLLDNYKNLLKGLENYSCIGKPLGTGKCMGCGACDTPDEISIITTMTYEKKRHRSEERKKICMLRLRGTISSRLAYVGNNFLFAAFARMLLLGIPRLKKNFIRFESAIGRHGSFGLFVADFQVREEFDGLALPDTEELKRANFFSKDLTIDSVTKATKPIRDSFPMIQLILHIENQPQDVDRKIDDMLNRYRIKHQKKWESMDITLRWDINPGHAKKTGFSGIQWKKMQSQLVFDIIHEPEQHYFDKLGLDFVSEISAPKKQG